ncbi:copper chaperone PCu(A)C [Pseudomonas sp. UM16]|uniref:copper chaperone PCu(A)C n=1 Tax=Pseudomonas sp. UM16 TaxID=3158962 RepID=UPI00398FA8D6
MVTRLLVFSALFAYSTLGVAQDYQLGELLISNPWSRELPVELPGGSAYFTVSNLGTQSDRLIAVSSPRAQQAKLHTQAVSNGLMNMQHVAVMDIPAQAQVKLQPGGNHVMLSGTDKPLKAGEQFPLLLEFEKAGKVEVLLNVQPADVQDGHAHNH